MRIIAGLVLIFAFLPFVEVRGAETDSTVVIDSTIAENIPVQLKKLTQDRFFRRTQMGLMVYDLTADTIIFTYNEKQRLRPASTIKLLTAITALDRLGRDYQFKTSFYYTGRINSRTLEGDIYCKGGFDPEFGRDDMDSLVAKVVALGIDTIKGRLIADISFKDDKRYGAGWCWDDDNDVLTPLMYRKKDIFMPIFKAKLQQKIILLNDTDYTEAVPDSATLFFQPHHDMLIVLERMMKQSNNLYAESMLYQIAASTGKKRVTASDGLTIIGNKAKEIGCSEEDYTLADGSGLSLYNYLTAAVECRFLKYAYHSEHIYQYLLPSLPIAGRDGTLKNRFHNTPAETNVRAKTGTLTGVSSLAGYCKAANGNNLCFVILNQGQRKAKEAKVFQDKICNILCK